VQRGSTVEVAFEDGTSETYTIVRQEEANPVRNLIGENSPLGMALLGASVDDLRRYRVRANGPEMVVRVREIV
jgi:transcription elongation GreA/GreB family factor